jgi:SIR2-like domain
MAQSGNSNQDKKFLSAATGSEWVTWVVADGSDAPARAEADNRRQKLEQLLTEVVLSENLVVLSGLGTTLCLNKSTGQKIAPTMSDLWMAASQKAGNQFDSVKTKVSYITPLEGDNIEALLSQCQLSEQLQPAKDVADFITNTEAIIVEKCRFVKEKTDLTMHEAFLRKVARRSTRQPRTKVFTTNYDLCFETAASHTGFIVVDGFSHTQPQEFDGSYFAYDFVRREPDREIPDYISNVFHMYKIHGSVDWELRDAQIVKSPAPAKPLIIYPRNTKFEASYEQPFIEMMSRFQLSLRQPNTGLLIVGFGFNDRHISQPIMSAVRSNVNLKAVVIDPALAGTSKEPVKEIENLIRKGDSRLVLLAGGFEDLVPILPDLVAATEEEQHRWRLRGVRESK